MTSAAAVNKVKWLTKAKKLGHAGTLDPLATGILPLAFGEATKCINLLMDAKKTYRFRVTFGERRSTDDAEGEVIATSSHIPTEADIGAILPSFTGEILQTPPIYSAIKVDGKRAYDLARAGENVALNERLVNVYELKLLGCWDQIKNPSPNPLPQGERASQDSLLIASSPRGRRLEEGGATQGEREFIVEFQAVVGKGTYIRSLGRDIAQTLGSEGYISLLHRASVGPFHEAQAISLDFLENPAHMSANFEGGTPEWLLPTRAALDDIPAVTIGEHEWQRLRHGHVLERPHSPLPLIGLLYKEELVALAESDGTVIKTKRLLNIT